MKRVKLIDVLKRRNLSSIPLEIAQYTSSVKSDIPLMESVIEINKAHIVMLTKQGIININDASQILKALDEIHLDINLDPRLEDVHMHVEAYVIGKLGEEVGGKLHVAKSRNDQVATAIRMTLRIQLLGVIQALIELRKVLLTRCEEYLKTVMPGYTHLQHGQPTTVAHHLLAYQGALERDTDRLMETFSRVNLSPMGACALATTSFNVDRKLVAELLGFNGLIENSIDAVSARDFVVEALAGFALIMTNLSRIGEELILWSTSEFSAVTLPDEYVSTSSIMPQKRNPGVAELLRAKTAHVYSDLIAALTILKALPLSYNLDLQEITPHLWNAYEVTLTSITMATGLLKGLKFDAQRWLQLASEDFSTATEIADMLVREHGIPFRTAYAIVKKLIHKMSSKKKKITDITPEILSAAIMEATGKRVQIDKATLLKALNPIESISAKHVTGGPAPIEVLRMKNERVKKIGVDEQWCQTRLLSLKEAKSRLHRLIKKIERGERV